MGQKKLRWQDALRTAVILPATFLLNIFLRELFDTSTLIPMIFVLGVFLISLSTDGYIWGIAVDRVLISNSTPNVDLGGGYSARVAIGQAADGSLILIFANDRGFYPSGITYSELASLMYEYGAVSAAAIRAEGAFYVDGGGQLGSKSENGFSLTVKGGAN